MAVTNGLALDGGSKRQKRQVRDQDISAEQLDEFFAALADSCNVAYAARLEDDRLDVNRETFLAGEAPSVPLVEVRE